MSVRDGTVKRDRVVAERFLLEPFFSEIERCLSLMRDTRAVARDGALYSFFSGSERFALFLSVHVPSGHEFSQWVRFLVAEGYSVASGRLCPRSSVRLGN